MRLGDRRWQRTRWFGLVVLLVAMMVSACGAAVAPPSPVAPTASGTIMVTDIVGRTVAVKAPVERVILGEGRSLYVVAMLEPTDPFKHVVGWAEDLKTADLDSYDKYRAKFPHLANIPIFGSPSTGAFSVENAIALKPDVVVLNLDSYAKAQELVTIDKLAQAGIPTVITDFRQQPLENTIPSVQLLGRLLGQEERAQQFVDYYLQQLNVVYSRLDKIKQPKPLVFLYRAAGLTECCGTFGHGNLGVLIERVGGRNLGSELLPGWSGTINPEQLLTADPEVVIVTGSNWTHANSKLSTYVSLGYSATPDESREQLKKIVAASPGWSTLKAVKEGRVFGVWHQFYNSPYHFVAIQQFAKWLYPEEFKDVDPDRTFREFHDQFLPIDYSGAFWVSLNG
jgi:iron complex transport system substrate-binding protein